MLTTASNGCRVMGGISPYFDTPAEVILSKNAVILAISSIINGEIF